jgi:hypothetical protein
LTRNLVGAAEGCDAVWLMRLGIEIEIEIEIGIGIGIG